MASNLRSSRVRAGSSAGEAVMLIHRPNVDTNLTWLISWLDLQLVFMMRQFHFQSLTWHCQSFDVGFLFVVIKKTFASQVCQLPFLVLSVSFLVLWRFFNQASGLPVVSRWFLQSAKSSTAKGISKRCSHVAVGISIDRVGVSQFGSTGTKNPISWRGKQHVDLLGIQTMSQGIHTWFFGKMSRSYEPCLVMFFVPMEFKRDRTQTRPRSPGVLKRMNLLDYSINIGWSLEIWFPVESHLELVL